MYHIKDDQRSIRSSEMIYEGLAKLMRDKDFATITITDLVDSAEVGRTTFYRNFDEIEDVLWMRCDQVVNGLIGYLQTYRQKHPDEPRTTILKPFLRYFYLHSELLELLMKAKRIHIFEEALAAYHVTPELQTWANGTAHLMNGSSEGSFTITYCPSDKLSRTDIEQVKYHYCALATALERYPAETMEEGWNTMPDGEEVFYIRTPAAGLWATKEKWPTAWWSSTRPLKIC